MPLIKHILLCSLFLYCSFLKAEEATLNPFSILPLPSTVLDEIKTDMTRTLPYKDTRDIQKTESITYEFGVIPLLHADGEEVMAIFDAIDDSGLLSEFGRITVDTRSNSLIVVDEVDKIEAIRKFVTDLDKPIQQVQIEARIVVMNEGALDELGVRWGVVDSTLTLPIGGTIEGSSASSVSSERIGQQLSVNLPASSGGASSLAFQLAKLGSGTLLDLELTALQSESKAEIISSPSLLTTNRKTAYIEQGTEIPYQETNSDGQGSVSFKKAVLSLEVTPYIRQGDLLTLDLAVTQDRPGEVVKTGNGEAVAIITQRINTQVNVKDGETIVLGGIQQNSTIESHDEVPILGSVPLLGRLFRRDYQKVTKNELLIFVTPTLLIQ